MNVFKMGFLIVTLMGMLDFKSCPPSVEQVNVTKKQVDLFINSLQNGKKNSLKEVVGSVEVKKEFATEINQVELFIVDAPTAAQSDKHKDDANSANTTAPGSGQSGCPFGYGSSR